MTTAFIILAIVWSASATLVLIWAGISYYNFSRKIKPAPREKFLAGRAHLKLVHSDKRVA